MPTEELFEAYAGAREAIPTIVTWNRLEVRPREEDFDRSLRVEVRDPLWMLTRQWQFGEFRGEDSGTAVTAKIAVATARINRYAVKDGEAVSYSDDLPLEVRVEREMIPFDLQTKIRLSRQWGKQLRNAGAAAAIRNAYLARYPIEDPSTPEEIEQVSSNPKVRQLYEAAKGRAINGETLLLAIASGDHKTWAESEFTGTELSLVLEQADGFAEWAARLNSQPAPDEESPWAPSYLEYQFACSLPAESGGQTVLSADQYYQGHLDWYSFDIDVDLTLSDAEGAAIDEVVPATETFSFIPSPIMFPGMPNPRWWEFEDAKTDLGGINANTTDIGQLLFAELGLIYGNDWSIIPYDMEAGSLCEIKGIVITNNFGERTLVRAAGAGDDDDWQRWNLFNLRSNDPSGKADNRLFLPPAVGKFQEGSPTEKVNLMRDEMANMVWAVENTVPVETGGGVDGFEEATRLTAWFEANYETAGDDVEAVETDAVISYLLGTTVPENWIPFIPVQVEGSNREVQLQRAAMPRLFEGTSSEIVKPRGVLMREGIEEDTPYYIHEEEVPRAGAIITRSFQRTRWYGGKVVTWLGRRKQTGKGEGYSGLKFDQIEDK